MYTQRVKIVNLPPFSSYFKSKEITVRVYNVETPGAITVQRVKSNIRPLGLFFQTSDRNNLPSKNRRDNVEK